MSGTTEKYFIEDRKGCREVFITWDARSQDCDLSLFHKLNQQMGDRGIVEVYLGTNPAGFVVELIGSENFAIMTLTDRDILHELCNFRDEPNN